MPSTARTVGIKLGVFFIIMSTIAPVDIHQIVYIRSTQENALVTIPHLHDKCHQQGHIAPECRDMPATVPNNRSGCSGRTSCGGRGRYNGFGEMYSQHGAQSHDSYYSACNPPDRIVPLLAQRHTSLTDIAPPDTFPCFSGVLHHAFSLNQRRRIHRWIFDNGCTAHSAFLPTMFQELHPCNDKMYAANGTVMSVAGIGTAGSLSIVLYLPDLQANLFSQKQAMREGASIQLSADGFVFTVTPIYIRFSYEFYI